MFAGARPTLNEIEVMPFPMPIIPYLSFLRWSIEGLYLTEVWEYRLIYNIDSGLELFGYTMNNYSLDLWMLFILGVALRAIACLVLVFGKRK